MFIFYTVSEIREYLNAQKANGKSIGFVPTMGALHNGHLSLIKRAKSENNIAVSSIFVNPTQFNDPKDYEKYPITTESDIEKLKSVDCDVLFLPSVAEMYENPILTILKPIDIGYLDTILEGEKRPGHYLGVVTIVEKLLLAIHPQKVFLGLKDFQQVKVIEKLVKDRNFPITIIGCPTIREPNGLAMSSRNMRLSSKGREEAGCIFRAIHFVKENKGSQSPSLILSASLEKYLSEIEVEYFKIRNAKDLSEVNLAKWEDIDYVIVFAGRLEGVRLIDNLIVES